jgi:hypothetical protein
VTIKDTYEAIVGQRGEFHRSINEYHRDYFGHQAECPEALLTCPNKCGMNNIKRKDMKDHRSQCPQEVVECPFAEAG